MVLFPEQTGRQDRCRVMTIEENTVVKWPLKHAQEFDEFSVSAMGNPEGVRCMGSYQSSKTSLAILRRME
jgi:hypothetical protein